MKPEIRKRYMVLVQFLGETLGPDYEIVLQEVGGENSGIIAIANGSISGRTVGSPLTNIALKLIMQRRYEHSDYVLNYTGQLENGKTLRSSTMFIKDEGALVGLLCINFDDSRYHALSDRILRLVHPDTFVETHYFSAGEQPRKTVLCATEDAERFQNDVAGLMQEIFDEVYNSMNIAPEALTQDDRQRIISQLYERGMFQLKGAVPFAMEKLCCSQASIYRYLSKVKNC